MSDEKMTITQRLAVAEAANLELLEQNDRLRSLLHELQTKVLDARKAMDAIVDEAYGASFAPSQWKLVRV